MLGSVRDGSSEMRGLAAAANAVQGKSLWLELSILNFRWGES
jgi:hypothetical protein